MGGDPTTTGGPHSSSGNSNDEVHFGGPNTYYTSEDNMSADADDEYGNDSDTPEYRYGNEDMGMGMRIVGWDYGGGMGYGNKVM